MVNDETKHQRHCLLFLFDEDNSISSRSAASRLEAVYGDRAMKRAACAKWLAKFRSGAKDLDDLEDEGRSGRPSTFDEDKLRRLVAEDPRVTIRQLTQLLDASIGSVHHHLHSIGMVSKLGKWVPHRLSEKNKADRVRIATKLLADYRSGALKLDDILTADEKWVLYANVRRKREWVQKGSIPGTTAKPGLHPRKIMLCVWWDSEGIVHWELMPNGETITAEVYCEQLDRVREALEEKRPHRLQTAFLHDNATPHTAKKTKRKLAELQWNTLPHPPYSPDLAPTDFKLFLSLHNALRDKEFKTTEEIRVFIGEFFSSKSSGFFVRGFTALPGRWAEVIEHGGEYPPE